MEEQIYSPIEAIQMAWHDEGSDFFNTASFVLAKGIRISFLKGLMGAAVKFIAQALLTRRSD